MSLVIGQQQQPLFLFRFIAIYARCGQKFLLSELECLFKQKLYNKFVFCSVFKIQRQMTAIRRIHIQAVRRILQREEDSLHRQYLQDIRNMEVRKFSSLFLFTSNNRWMKFDDFFKLISQYFLNLLIYLLKIFYFWWGKRKQTEKKNLEIFPISHTLLYFIVSSVTYLFSDQGGYQGYPPPQQPTVGFVNPGYPQPGGYAPQQPGYAPQQPGFPGSFAPGYAPQQPNPYQPPQQGYDQSGKPLNPPYMDDTDPNYKASGFGFDDKTIRAGFIRRVYSILSVSEKTKRSER